MPRMSGLLSHPLAYLWLQRIIGGMRARRMCIEQHVKPRQGDRVLDIGCGPGYLLDYLPEVEYVGFDTEPGYISYANRRYAGRGDFFTEQFAEDKLSAFEPFDFVTMMGILHHLNDEQAADLLRLAGKALRPGGKVISLDGCYRDGQSPIARHMLARDRGEFVRSEDGYLGLTVEVFDQVNVHVREDMFYIPYTIIILECAAADEVDTLRRNNE